MTCNGQDTRPLVPAARPVCLLGDDHQSGAYALGIHLTEPLVLTFGRFQGGRPVALSQGCYVYIGSAMGQRGSSSLARRLLRHATRGGDRSPHPVRPALLASLRAAGLGPDPLQPPTSKTLRWHIDYLLDHPAAALVAVLAVRSAQALERPLVDWIAHRPEAVPVAPGLGASDHPGHSHLFRVTAAGGLWQELAQAIAPL